MSFIQGFPNLQFPLMQPTNNEFTEEVLTDLNALINEIENNPSLSSWAIRLTLKSIRDKAKKMTFESMPKDAKFAISC
ncbi:hypothetical protein [Trichocoleus sp. FACHB-69]|uniref:hypothetical protein n=2 Tax=Cyanophyceae TaxID=3028117 RepID=UPI001A7EA6E5|nr:hypothetical protein [Trichocoleus sp. FACHB-69]